jgi:hypothetical protein
MSRIKHEQEALEFFSGNFFTLLFEFMFGRKFIHAFTWFYVWAEIYSRFYLILCLDENFFAFLPDFLVEIFHFLSNISAWLKILHKANEGKMLKNRLKLFTQISLGDQGEIQQFSASI